MMHLTPCLDGENNVLNLIVNGSSLFLALRSFLVIEFGDKLLLHPISSKKYAISFEY